MNQEVSFNPLQAKVIIKVYQMRKTKQQHYFKPNLFKNEEVPPKILAKSPLNFRQRKLPGQSSAVPAIRSRQRDPNPFKLQKPISPYNSPVKDKSSLTQEQVVNSNIYKQMEEEIMSLIKRQESEFQKLDQMRLSKEAQIKQTKDEQHEIKLQIWQLRNETMQLKDALQSEQEEYQKLMYELEITEEEFENHLRQAQEAEGFYQQNEAEQKEQEQQNEEGLDEENEETSSVEGETG